MNEKVVIIIPTYNEADVIGETILALADIRAMIHDFDLDVLIFDSASKDTTQAVVTELQAQFTWLHLQKESHKSGLGSAYMQAMQYALATLSADIVVEFDADLSHQPKYLLPMLERIKTHDVVLGSRYVPEGSIPKDWGWRRKIISILGNQVARLILTTQYKDFTSGFRMTRRAMLQEVLGEQFISNHYAYKLQLLWRLHQCQATICEYPIVFVDRVKGQSKLPANSIIDSLRVLLILRSYEIKRFLKQSVRIYEKS